MITVEQQINDVQRLVGTRVLEAGEARTVTVIQTYDAAVEDVWDACTNPERIPRWFLPVSGDLRLGGRYQLEGNAGGTITTCEPPHRLQLTWQFGDTEPSLVSLELAPASDDTTELVLRHTVPEDDHWAQYGPGAVGVGWDGALAGLTAFIAGDVGPNDDQLMADFMRMSADLWGAAHQATAATAEAAQDAAARTRAAYAPSEQSSPH